MARINRGKQEPRKKPIPVKRKSKNMTNKLLCKLLIANLLLTAFSCLADYEKYVEISKKLMQFLGY